ncbi:MAG TPA: tRNA (adenosine(37)-N6)-threonylcarbamoyltransferase complex transferase subunit TsaD [Acidobacteriaceae bacterium]|nr:tRNA (adenosine(37)-N6)-threonylcarbamoyltransferase complex transferase subunit TsaD [Acidobacteriaceae bacterium]
MGGSGLGGIILGIESSCDETAAAVVRGGCEVLASVVASQMTLHAEYGGVVPELASREHLKNIVPVVREAMRKAGVGFADLDAVAVTEGPGLAGALLVGITYAKALAAGLGKPLIGVNHLEGHIHAVLMESEFDPTRPQDTRTDGAPGFEAVGPLMALVVSGGHTHLYLAEHGGGEDKNQDKRRFPSGMTTKTSAEAALWRYRNVGRTVDDAAGEAFDKVAKLLGLGYPGGPWMDALAKLGNPRAVEFRFGPIRRKAEGDARSFDFSFSGIKTAVLRYVQTHGMKDRVEARRARLGAALKERPDLRAADAVREMPGIFDQQTLDLIASFQSAVVGNLLKQTFAAADAWGARGVIVSGGVAANSELRRRFGEEAARRKMPVKFPAMAMATDNAAMIAAAAWGKFAAGEFAGDELVARAGLRLGD